MPITLYFMYHSHNNLRYYMLLPSVYGMYFDHIRISTVIMSRCLSHAGRVI
jgi:hypothetical protein